MDFVRAIALLAHPILACALIIWIWKQYSWRKTSKGMKGQVRKDALEKHEKNGQFILWAGFIVVLIAFIGRMVAGIDPVAIFLRKSGQLIFMDSVDLLALRYY